MAVALAHDRPVTTTRPTAPHGAASPEAARLIARAGQLLIEGNVGAARLVLDRAAEMGSAQAWFLLAQTYDPLSLSAWGTLGTQGDPAKAQELYTKALVGGVQEAKDRLNALRQ
jgi:TPR repeat protein